MGAENSQVIRFIFSSGFSMKLRFSSSEVLWRSSDAIALQDKLLQQLQKDFIRANIDLDFPNQDAQGKHVIALLHEKIYQLLMEHFDGYLNLMYAIDIPEASLRNILPTDQVEVAHATVHLVLERELQKVIYKSS